MPMALAIDLYTRMVLIREVEEAIAVLYPDQEMRCPTHLSIGQEAVAAGVCAALKKTDAIFLNHRCHAGYLAKGGNLKKLFAELYGKKTGCTGGWGGSMHLVDPAAGILGTSAIVSGTIPIACGAAFGFSRAGSSRVAVCFFGDAAPEEGTFFESINLAALWKLPVLFICESNLYSTCTPLSKRQVPAPIATRVGSFGLPAVSIDGNDVFLVYQTARTAIERARRGQGPSFIECRTYRWREHVGPNYDWNLGYRRREEVEAWMKKCPIQRCEKRLLASQALSEKKKREIYQSISKQVKEAIRFGKASPFPDPREIDEKTPI